MGLPVVLGNDANLGALAEAACGAAQDRGSAFAAFVGTGLGAGLVHRSRVVNGAHGFAGEFGHMPAPFDHALCGCGHRGCLETVASRRGILRLIREAARRGEPCRVRPTAAMRSSELREAWRKGCPATRKAVTACADALAWGLVAAGMVFDPAVFVLGGGVMEALGAEMLPRIRARMAASCTLYARVRPEVRLAELGDDAVAVGAAVAAGSLL
jgi:glucokinase